MELTEPPTILFTIPEKKNDPTFHTAQWARNAVRVAKNLGYKVITLEKEQVTYNNLVAAFEKYNPRVYVHYGHGCTNNLQGQTSCIITRRYGIEETVGMALSGDIEKVQIARALLDPLYYLSDTCDKRLCQLQDPCDTYCLHNTNVELLRDKIAFTVACFSAAGLGKCAIRSGADSYIGTSDLFLFPVDSMGTQDIYGQLQLIGFRELLFGRSVAEAEAKMSEVEDKLITRFKPIKYVALTLLFNKIHRRVLGDPNAMI